MQNALQSRSAVPGRPLNAVRFLQGSCMESHTFSKACTAGKPCKRKYGGIAFVTWSISLCIGSFRSGVLRGRSLPRPSPSRRRSRWFGVQSSLGRVLWLRRCVTAALSGGSRGWRRGCLESFSRSLIQEEFSKTVCMLSR